MKDQLSFTQKPYSNPELDKHIETLRLHTDESVILLAGDLVLANRPRLGEHIRSIVEPVQQVYQGLLSHCHQKTQATIGMHKGKTAFDTMKKQNNRLDKQISALRMKAALEEDKSPGTLLVFPLLKLFSCFVLMLALVGFEMFFIAHGLTTDGTNFGEALGMATGLVLAFMLFAHSISWLVGMIESPTLRKAVAVVLILLVVIAFYTLAVMRVAYLKQHDMQADLSPAMLTIFNIIIFLALYYLSNAVMGPAWTEIVKYGTQAFRNYRLKSLEKEKDENEEAATDKGYLRVEVWEYAKDNEMKIDSYYRASVAKLINEILNKIGFYHPCFDEPLPPLEFFYVGKENGGINFNSGFSGPTNVASLLILPGILSALILSSCGSKPHQTVNAVYTILDTTDQHLAVSEVNLKALKPYLGVEKDITAGSRFTLATVSGIRYNATHRVSLESTDYFSQNEFARKKEVLHYYHLIDSAITNIQKRTRGSTASSQVLYALASGLTELAGNPANHKHLLLFSDLAENSYAMSVYQPEVLSLFETKPDSMATVVSRLYNVPSSLVGVTVYCIHSPKSEMEDERFAIMGEFVKVWLEKRGAFVKVVANL